MKEKFNDIIHSKKIIVILTVILSILVGVASTYAWFTWSSTNNTSLTMSIGELADVTFSSGNDISTSTLAPVFNYTDGERTTFSINNKTDTEISYKVLLNITSIADELKSSSLKYKLLNNNTVVAEGDFSNITSNSSTSIYESTLSKGSINYIFYLYIDGNIENDLVLMGKSLIGNIMIEASKSSNTIVDYVTDLYTNAAKTEVTNNGIIYNYAKSVALMNDKLGNSSTDIDSGNIRYYGASPNNYIYFNCDDYSNQTSDTCELWRIIGVFNEETPSDDGTYVTEKKIKIIRNTSIGAFSFDNVPTMGGIGTHAWVDSKIMKMLNSGYEGQTGGSLYWNRQTGECYSGRSANETKTCALANVGLKNDVTKNMISDTKYTLRGWNVFQVYSDQMYTYERTTGQGYNSSSKISWDGKVALAYPSDYGYAADLELCTVNLSSYNDNNCVSNNWMKAVLTKGAWGWFITPKNDLSNGAWFVISTGSVTYTNVFNEYNIVPTFYINSSLEIKDVDGDGYGTADNPYQLAV